MEHYLGVAKEKGLTDEEIGAVESIVVAVAGGRVIAQLQDVISKGSSGRRDDKAGCGNQGQ